MKEDSCPCLGEPRPVKGGLVKWSPPKDYGISAERSLLGKGQILLYKFDITNLYRANPVRNDNKT